MATKKIEEWKKALSETARELDEKFRLREKVEQAGEMASDVARKAGTVIMTGIEHARQEYERLDAERRISETVKATASKVEEVLKTGSQVAGEKAEEVKREIEKHYRRWESFSEWMEEAGRTTESVRAAVNRARTWASSNPGKVVAVTVSVITGVRAATAFARLDATLLGLTAGQHWFFHSALAPYALRRLTEKYVDYLKEQERLLAEGRLSDVEKTRCEFQRNVVKYVGAPLLGVFSVTLGGTLIAESLNPSRIVGMPIDLILGGNPVLSSIWLFANGLMCIHNGYKFFLIALADAEEVHRVARQIKGLLPAPAE
ncbi:MAG TPA: hypothetical protein VNM72_00705 [Blastocatellia bacterium]|nr:hypothetical protein [Blastocatellia bacterium]